ncbi:MAG: hypothetical protein IT338_20210 [Thermomicrobiales bacterium]|nr:hypothetical protein [Thermomicrobiales bacterium]
MATKTDITATNLTEEDRKFLEQNRDLLSRSTLTAKWINAPGEKADRDGQTLATRNPEVIKAWAETRGGQPATVPGTEHNGRPGVLRFAFGGSDDKQLQDISWDDWLGTFEQRHLVFLFQQTKTDGDQSNFFRLDSPDREDA